MSFTPTDEKSKQLDLKEHRTIGDRLSQFTSSCMARFSPLTKRAVRNELDIPEGLPPRRLSLAVPNDPAIPSESDDINIFSLLLEEEAKLLTDSWKHLRTDRAMANQMFIDLFTEKPHLKKFFKIDHIASDQLWHCDVIPRHASHFMGFIGVIVDSLIEVDHQDSAVDSIIMTGRMHVSLGIKFDAENWLPFKQMIRRHFCKNQNELTCRAWNKFISLLVSQMKQAFHAEVRRRSSSTTITNDHETMPIVTIIPHLEPSTSQPDDNGHLVPNTELVDESNANPHIYNPDP